MFRKNFLYKILALSFIFATSLISHVAHADDKPVQVSITDLSLSKDVYDSGEVVTGSFILTNANPSVNVPDVMYQVSLVGEFGPDTIPRVFYDIQTFGPVFLEMGEANKLVTFNYKLPAAYSGQKMGIHVRAILKSGAPLAWVYKNISVTGGKGFATLTTAKLVIDGKTFSNQVGPTLHKDKSGSLSYTLSNTSKESIKVIPHISIYDQTISGPLVREYDETPLELAVGSKKEYTYDLPTMDNKPGVYLGVVTFPDSDDIPRVSPLHFRYIIAGDIVTIKSLTTPTSSVVKGSPINLTLNYAGAPYDISTGSSVGNGNADLSISLYNEKDILVGEYKEAVDFNKDSFKDITVTATHDAKALRADVTVIKEGKQLDSYSTVLSADYESAKKESETTPDTSPSASKAWYIVIPILILTLIIAGYVFARRKVSPTAFMVLMAITGFAAFSFSSVVLYAFETTFIDNQIQVWNYYQTNETPTNTPGERGYHPFSSTKPWLQKLDASRNLVPQVILNPDTPSWTKSPGAVFYVTGTTWADACLNNPQDIEVSATLQGVKKTVLYDSLTPDNQGHTFFTGPHTDFAIGPFTAPTATGSYKIYLKIVNYINIPGRRDNAAARQASSQRATPVYMDSAGGIREGEQLLTVTAPTPLVTLTATPTSVGYNGTTKLKWTSTNATSCTSTNFATGNAANNTLGVDSNPITTTTTFTITCSGGGGSVSDDVTVTVSGSLPTPIITLTGTPNPVAYGAKSFLRWSSQNATSCTSSDFLTGGAANNTVGVETTALTAAKAYTITCTGSGGTASKSVTVNVTGQPVSVPTVDLTITPNPVAYNTAALLKWTSSNATSGCTSAHFDTGGAASNSSGVSTGALRTQKTYIITCSNSAGSTSDTVTVNVNPDIASLVSVDLNSNICTGGVCEMQRGGDAILTWTTSNATACVGTTPDYTDSVSGDWDTTRTAGGSSYTVNNLTSDTVFTIKCTGATSADISSDFVRIHLTDTPISTTSNCKAYDISTHAHVPTVKTGTTVDWKIIPAVSGASKYTWEGTNPMTDVITNDTDTTNTVTYTQSGIKTAQVTVSFSNGRPDETLVCTSLPVRNPPTFIEL